MAQHAGHTEAVLQQRQLKDPSQTGEGGGKGTQWWGWKRRKRGQEQGSEHKRKEKEQECNTRKIVGQSGQKWECTKGKKTKTN